MNEPLTEETMESASTSSYQPSTDQMKQMALILSLVLTGFLLIKLAMRMLFDKDLNEDEAIEGLADIVSEV